MLISENRHLGFLGQSAVVTGAGSGIGRAIAQALAAEGASVLLVGRQLAKLETTASEIRAAGGTAYSYAIDITDDWAIKTLQSRITDQFGQVNLLVHNAAAYSMAPLETASVADFDRLYRTNVRAPYLLTQALLPLFVPQSTQIVFVNSTAGLAAKAGVGQFAATKFALKAIADSVRAEVNTKGIRVLSVFPGRTATPTQEAIFAMEGRTYEPEKLLQPEQVAEVVLSSLKLPLSAEVTDVTIRGTVNMSVNTGGNTDVNRSANAWAMRPKVHAV